MIHGADAAVISYPEFFDTLGGSYNGERREVGLRREFL